MPPELKELLIQYKVSITIVIIGIFLLIFRKEFNKLLNWLICFKRIAKTKDGYSASTSSESAGTEQSTIITDDEQFSDKKQLSIEESKPEKSKDMEPDTNWVIPFINNDYKKSREILQDMISREQNPQKRMDHRLKLGHVILQENKQMGIEYFQDLIRNGTTDQFVYCQFGRSLISKDDFLKAIEILKEGLKHYPSDPELVDWLAWAHSLQKEYIESVKILRDNLNQNPTYTESYNTLILIFKKIGMLDLALKCCKIGMIRCPQNINLIEKYIEILPEINSTKEKMSAYLRLTEIQPNNPSYWTSLGNECLMLDFNDLALEAYHKGNSLAKEKESWILENIGNIMRYRGFYSRGAEYLKHGLQINPDSQYGHERLGQALKSAKEEKDKQDKIRKEIDKNMKENCDNIDLIMEQFQTKLKEQTPPTNSP